ncbi:hypothetical protein HanRHA438_Chr08g0360651 [Helianthus annuus]|nr:hypothetical protein HanRHA438_Chr08g0360651 [Helianthus annuus]
MFESLFCSINSFDFRWCPSMPVVPVIEGGVPLMPVVPSMSVVSSISVVLVINLCF